MEEKFCPKCAIQRLEEAQKHVNEWKAGTRISLKFAIGHLAHAIEALEDYMPKQAGQVAELHDLLIREPAKTNSRLDFTDLITNIRQVAMLED